MLTLARCDDRLIHGQCMTVIIKEYDIERILVVDDFTAKNPILKTVFQKAMPSELKGDVYTIKDSVPEITEAMNNDERTLLLMKNPIVYMNLRKEVANLPLELNIGPMSNRRGTTPATQTAHLLPQEADAIKELTEEGVHVYFRQVPSQKTVEWDEVKDKF
ncbi:PTS sugar transporter subunit IIB [Clostridium sp.]|uniref:PTS system mannose/fructose/N-acetylgalactosamine-transporter subunit IIB n=1 Tax=Clostridium sp. TaxID=1506 RepID=UPI00290BE558|nr:PTS sugar transporter subunit IIB [Clostridium sp.]MDU5107849.1 PTS sugar transporter subunit IIB [Clostridium sp.]